MLIEFQYCDDFQPHNIIVMYQETWDMRGLGDPSASDIRVEVGTCKPSASLQITVHTIIRVVKSGRRAAKTEGCHQISVGTRTGIPQN